MEQRGTSASIDCKFRRNINVLFIDNRAGKEEFLDLSKLTSIHNGRVLYRVPKKFQIKFAMTFYGFVLLMAS